MLYILLGENDYGKQEFINSLAAQKKAEILNYHAEDDRISPAEILQNDLFSKPKVFIFHGFVPDYFLALAENQTSKNDVAVLIGSLDKRKKENKELLENKAIKLEQFDLPHGLELNAWLIKRVSDLDGRIDRAAAEELAVRLGRDNAKETKVGGRVISVQEVFNLHLADSEIRKLLAYSQNKMISPESVKELVSENGEVEVFDLTNALGEGDKLRSVSLMHRFLKDLSFVDEKSAVIQLNALLSEQFRNIYMVQNFLEQKVSEDKILEQTGWKSGRLFIMKKMAGKYPSLKIRETLSKLQSLDQELKTSQTPPRVLLDLIIAQLF